MSTHHTTDEALRREIEAHVGVLVAGALELPAVPARRQLAPAPCTKADVAGTKDGKVKKYRRVHRMLMKTATDEPIPTKVFIKQAGYDPNSYSRDAVTDLVRWGDLNRSADGVCKPRSNGGVP